MSRQQLLSIADAWERIAGDIAREAQANPTSRWLMQGVVDAARRVIAARNRLEAHRDQA